MLFKKLYLMVGGIKNVKVTKSEQFFITLALPFDNASTISANSISQFGNNQQNLQVIKNLPLGNGTGYRLLVANQGQPRIDAEGAWQNNYGLFGAKYINFEHNNNYELNARGSVIHFDSTTLLARHLDHQSFALVKVPGYSHVNVYYRNQLVGRTNKAGYVFVPDLLPYQVNEIKINPLDFPLDTTFYKTKKTVIPYYQSGVLINFKVKKSRNLFLTIIQENNQPIPAGANVSIDKTIYPVGYDGQVFIANPVGSHITGEVTWADNRCYFDLAIAELSQIINKEQVICR